jgi:hypothetical protein
MNAKAKVRATTANEPLLAHTHRVLAGHAVEVNTLEAMNDAKTHEAPANERTMAATIGMLVAAPFIGLAYCIALPAIGIYHLARLSFKACANKAPATFLKMKKAWVTARNIGLFFAAPIVALGYVIALPFVGFYLVARLAMEAHGRRVCAES